MLYVFPGISQLPDDFVSTCISFLPKWRLDQMMGYRFPSDRKQCAAAYMVLVYALKHEGLFNALPEFGFGPDRKPFLINYPGIYFNLSHSDDVVVCLISDMDVGVDVEKVRDYDDELAQAICNDNEYLWISGFPDPGIRAEKLTELWTRKESVVKWQGTGLKGNPRDIPSGSGAGNADEGLHIYSHREPNGNFYISVCYV